MLLDFNSFHFHYLIKKFNEKSPFWNYKVLTSPQPHPFGKYVCIKVATWLYNPVGGAGASFYTILSMLYFRDPFSKIKKKENLLGWVGDG